MAVDSSLLACANVRATYRKVGVAVFYRIHVDISRSIRVPPSAFILFWCVLKVEDTTAVGLVYRTPQEQGTLLSGGILTMEKAGDGVVQGLPGPLAKFA